MWEQIAKPRQVPPHATVVFLGSLAARSFETVGPVSDTEILTYRRLEQPSKERESPPLCTLDIYRLRTLDRGIVDPIPISGRCLVVYMLNWLKTELWAEQLKNVESLVKRKNWSLLLSVGGDLKKLTIPLASRASALDLCHQYIRTAAIRMHASLAYSTDPSSPLDMRALLKELLGMPLSDRTQSESLYGTQVVIYEDDSREKVLAVNPDFDFESALSAKMSLPILAQNSDQHANLEPVRGLPEELQDLLSNYPSNSTQDSGKQVSKAVLEGTDDKNIISEFFSTMVQRSK